MTWGRNSRKPKGKSSNYNSEKFSKEKSKIHFTDEMSNKKNKN